MQGTLYKHIDPDRPEWFLEGAIQMSELNLLVGLPKLGKDMLGAALIGLLTTGRPLPDGSEPETAGSAIMVTPEDPSNMTTRPRLDAAGADNDRVLDLTYVQRQGAGNSSDVFSIADDVGILRDAIMAMPECRLVWISPLNYAAGINIRSNDNTIRRRIIGPLQALARETGVAIVLVHHFVKSGAIGGSQAIVDAPRSLLVLERDPNNPEIRVLKVDRSTNGSSSARPIRYVIEGIEPYSRARFLEDVGTGSGGLEEPVERGKRPRPGTGQARVLDALEKATEPVTSQCVMKETDIDHMIVKVYLNRLIEAGWAERVGRNQYSAKVTVTTPDQGESAEVTVTPHGTYRWRAEG